MTTVAEQDPRAGLGEAIDAFRGRLRDNGFDTDEQLREIADYIGADVSTLYRWMSKASGCRSKGYARLAREKMAEIEENLL